MGTTDSWQALGRAAAFGPYFAVEHATGASGWLQLSALTDPADDMLLRERVAFVRGALASMAGRDLDDIDLRAAASTHALALCSRLVAPALATAVTDDVVIALRAEELLWQPVPSGPVPIALTHAEAVHGASLNDSARLIHDHVIATAVQPLVDAFVRAFALSPQVVWGNVSSALAGAAVMIRHASPAHGATALEIVTTLTTMPLLAGYGGYTGGSFVRTNCCLFYRVPGGGLCGDCVLRHRPDRGRPVQPTRSSAD